MAKSRKKKITIITDSNSPVHVEKKKKKKIKTIPLLTPIRISPIFETCIVEKKNDHGSEAS